MIKAFRLALFLFALPLSAAPLQPLPSATFPWCGTTPKPSLGGESRDIIKGSALGLSELTVEGVTLDQGATLHYTAAENTELLVIVKNGTLEAEIGAQAKTLSKGGVAYLLPGDSLVVLAAGAASSTFYLFRFTSETPADTARGIAAGGSVLLPWDEVHYEPSERGGYRQQLRRPTALFDTFEMHVTTMNPGLFNHEVHTHHAEELVLMIGGTVDMQLDGKTINAQEGDLMFLGADVPHGMLRNLGAEPTEYFAFQWWQ
ncbi:MAG: cupin domain-containing protein [Opitutales bacterium]|jgi:(S)-ureidoglycine aminohydrolase